MQKNVKHVECINKVRAEMKAADPSLGYVKFKIAGTNGITGQAIEYSETKTKRDGTTKVIIKRSFVKHDYCPYCGEKYI